MTLKRIKEEKWARIKEALENNFWNIRAAHRALERQGVYVHWTTIGKYVRRYMPDFELPNKPFGAKGKK